MRIRRAVQVCVGVGCWLLLWVSASAGQAPAGVIHQPVIEGACRFSVSDPGWSGVVTIAGGVLQNPDLVRTTLDTTVLLKAPLRRGETVVVEGADGSRDQVRVIPVDPVRPWPPCEKDVNAPSPDQRSTFTANFSAGFLSETFAPQKSALMNAEVTDPAAPSSGTIFTRDDSVAILFETTYRPPVPGLRRHPVVFLGRAFYGKRTGVCDESVSTNADGGDPCVPAPDQALSYVRRADTAEVYIGARWEALPFFDDSEHPGAFYLTCILGSIFIEHAGDKALSNHTCGGGLTLVGGRFRETYAEVGMGKSEIFAPDESHWNRKKFSTYVTARVVNRDVRNGVGNVLNSFRPYFRFTLDRGDGPDAFYTSFGFVWDFVRVFGTPF